MFTHWTEGRVDTNRDEENVLYKNFLIEMVILNIVIVVEISYFFSVTEFGRNGINTFNKKGRGGSIIMLIELKNDLKNIAISRRTSFSPH